MGQETIYFRIYFIQIYYTPENQNIYYALGIFIYIVGNIFPFY